MSGTNGAEDLIGRIRSILTQANELWRGYMLSKEWLVANHRAERLAYFLLLELMWCTSHVRLSKAVELAEN